MLLASAPPLYARESDLSVCTCGLSFQGSKKVYKFLVPYLHLCEPHFDSVVGEVTNAARRSVAHIRTRSTQILADRADNVVELVRCVDVAAVAVQRLAHRPRLCLFVATQGTRCGLLGIVFKSWCCARCCRVIRPAKLCPRCYAFAPEHLPLLQHQDQHPCPLCQPTRPSCADLCSGIPSIVLYATSNS